MWPLSARFGVYLIVGLGCLHTVQCTLQHTTQWGKQNKCISVEQSHYTFTQDR